MIPADPLRNLGPATILRADARDLPLADNSVDLIVTSPPYFALRSYQDAGEHYAGQLGSEATPAEFVDALIDCTREMVRVVKPSGSIWINLGDKYSGASGGDRNIGFNERWGNASGKRAQERSQTKSDPVAGFRPKTLLGIPWRYALRCIDDLGIILRAEVIWSKPNGLPESVTDRVRRSHEDWFHFTLEPRYYSAVDEIREEHEIGSGGRQRAAIRQTFDYAAAGFKTDMTPGQRAQTGIYTSTPNPLGKLPGSVWTVPTEPLRVPDHLGIDHFAAFPSEWPKRIIRGWSPAGVCTACGEGRRPVVARDLHVLRPGDQAGRAALNGEATHGRDNRAGTHVSSTNTITGYACACPQPTAPTTPALILDPFGGTGTVAMVARALGRHGLHVDLSADYNRLARWRITNLDQLAAIQGHQRSKRQPDDQPTLLDHIENPA